jgi:hypothetical protein
MSNICIILFMHLCSFSAMPNPQDAAFWRPQVAGAGPEPQIQPDSDSGGDLTPPSVGKLPTSASSASLNDCDSTHGAADGKHSPIDDQASAASRGGQALRAENVALVCIHFSRLREPPQLIQPLPAPSAPSSAAQQAAGGGGSNRSSFRVLSTASSQREGSMRPRRLTGGSSAAEGDFQQRDSCIEIPLTHVASKESMV